MNKKGIRMNKLIKVIAAASVVLCVNSAFAGCDEFNDNGKVYPIGYSESACASYQHTCSPVGNRDATFTLRCATADYYYSDITKNYSYKAFIRCHSIENINGILRCRN